MSGTEFWSPIFWERGYRIVFISCDGADVLNFDNKFFDDALHIIPLCYHRSH